MRNVESQVNSDCYDKIVDICAYYLINENKGKAAYIPDDNQTRTFLSTANAYALSNIRWILDKIETHGNPVKVDLSDLSIELKQVMIIGEALQNYQMMIIRYLLIN